MKFRPTIIIGIGTSGGEIIRGTRELFFEEFQTYDMPSVQFIHITSDNSVEQAKSLIYGGNFSTMNEIKINFDRQSFASLPLLFDQTSPQYRPEIADWCDPSVAGNNAAYLSSGLQNDRHLGRLALWLKWAEVQAELDRVINSVNQQDNKNNTQSKLQAYARRRGLNEQINIDQKYNVYIVGSLHGGTCSGSFLDIAFYLSALANIEVIGIFTMMGSPIAYNNRSTIVAANGYGALVELDYYMQNKTEYDYRLPGTGINFRGKTPFNGVYLVSTHDESGRAFAISDQQGNVDLDSLHQMVSIPLFINILGFDDISGLYKANSSGLQVQYKTSDKFRWNLEYPYLKFLISYCSKAVWHPKNRISALAAVRFLNKEVIPTLQDSSLGIDTTVAKRSAESILQEIKLEIFNEMRKIDGDGKTLIHDDLNKFYNTLDSNRLEKSVLIDEFKHVLLNEPNNDPKGKMVGRFKVNGSYFSSIVERQKIFENLFIRKFEDRFHAMYNQALTSLGAKSNNSLPMIDTIKTELINLLQNYAATNLSIRDEDFSELEPYFDMMAIEQKRVSTILVGVRSVVIKQHFDNLMAIVKGKFDQLEENLLEFCFARVVDSVRLRIQQQAQQGTLMYSNKIDNLKSKLTDAEKELGVIKEYSTLDIVFENYITSSDGSYDRESSFNSDVLDTMKLINIQAIAANLNDELNKYFGSTITDENTVLKCTLELIGIIQKQLLANPKLLNSSIQSFQYFQNSVNKRALANISPMLELQNYRGNLVDPGQATTFICGLSTDSERNLMKNNLNTLLETEGIRIDGTIDVNLPHILLVHKEKPDISIDETAAFHAMKAKAIALNNHKIFSDRKGRSKVDIRRHMIKVALEEEKLLKIIIELFPETEIFEKGSGEKEYLFKYVTRYNVNAQLVFKPQNGDYRDPNFERLLIENSDALREFLRRVNGIASIPANQIMPRIQILQNQIQNDGNLDDAIKQELMDFYDKLSRGMNGDNNQIPRILFILKDFKNINITTLDI